MLQWMDLTLVTQAFTRLSINPIFTANLPRLSLQLSCFGFSFPPCLLNDPLQSHHLTRHALQFPLIFPQLISLSFLYQSQQVKSNNQNYYLLAEVGSNFQCYV